MPLYFTARLVNAIAGGGDAEPVWRTLWLLLLSTAAAGTVRAVAGCWDDTLRDSHQWPAWNRVFFQKLLSMDFCDVDDPKTQALFTQIGQDDMWREWGLNQVYTHYGRLVEAVFRILGALALSVTLFTLPVPAESPLSWLNAPACLVGMPALLVLTVAASFLFEHKRMSYYSLADGNEGNRLYVVLCCSAMIDRYRGTDIRTYEQDGYIRKKAEETMPMDPLGGMKGRLAAASRGPLGLLIGASKAVDRTFTGMIYLFVGLKAVGGAFGVGSVTQYVVEMGCVSCWL